MSSQNTYTPPKKPHKHRALKVILWIFLLLIVLPVSLLYILFFNGSTSSFVGADDKQPTALLYDKVAASLTGTQNSHSIDIDVTQDDLNQLLYTSTKDMLKQTGGYVKKLSVEINSDEYRFFADVEVPLFKTRLELATSLTEIKNETNPELGSFIFAIKDIKVGRIGGLTDIALNTTKSFLNDASIETAFAGAGLSVDSDLANKKITYEKADFLKDITALFSAQNTDVSLYSAILSDCLHNNLFNFSFYEGKQFGASIALEQLHSNSTYSDASKELGLNLNPYSANLEQLLKSNIIKNDATLMKNVFEYLVNGYDRASAASKSAVSSLNLTDIGITDYTAYKGTNLTYAKSVETAVTDKMNLPDIMLGKISTLSEAEINDVIKTTSIVGYSFIMEYYDDENGYVTNYVTIDNFYCNITSTGISFVVGLTFNGYETTVVLKSDGGTSANNKLTLNITNAYFGNLAASEAFKKAIFSLLSESIASISGWASFNGTSGVMTLDFGSIIAASPYKDAIEAAGTAQITLKGDSLSDVGYLDLTIA